MVDKAKTIIKEDACMKFLDEMKPLCTETDASGVGLEQSYYRQEMVQVFPEIRHQTTAYLDPSHLQARGYQAWKKDTAT